MLLLAGAQPGSSYNCVNCALGTQGTCKDSASGLCWPGLPGTGQCPQPTQPCDISGNVPRGVSGLDADGFPQFVSLPSRPEPQGPCPTKKSIAYFRSPFATWKADGQHLNASYIDAELITHGVYYAAQISQDPPYSVYYVADREMAVMHDFVRAMRQSACSRAVVSIGAYYFDSPVDPYKTWTSVAQSTTYRAAFVQSALKFARRTGFDGIELVRRAMQA